MLHAGVPAVGVRKRPCRAVLFVQVSALSDMSLELASMIVEYDLDKITLFSHQQCHSVFFLRLRRSFLNYYLF